MILLLNIPSIIKIKLENNLFKIKYFFLNKYKNNFMK
jgi:hypothetical protein